MLKAQMDKVIQSDAKGTNGSSRGRICGYPADIYSWASWRESWKNEINCQPLYVLFIFTGGLAAYFITSMPFFVTHPLFTDYGDDGMLAYLNVGNVSALLALLLMFGLLLLSKFMMHPRIYDTVRKAKHLMSAAIYESRFSSVKKSDRAIAIILIFILVMYTILLPYGMAMQAYGIKEITSWPSPANLLFNQPGAPMNMLGAPLHTLVSKTLSTILVIRYVDVAY